MKAYNGPLYQVSRTDADGKVLTKDIGPISPGGVANSADQDAFCVEGEACTISIIYDQSGQGNHLTKAPPGEAKKTGGKEADARALPIQLGGKKVYGEHNAPGIGYRNNQAKGLAKGDDAQTMYMIAGRSYFNGGCCFDYGNAETNSKDNGEGTMEAVYFGSCTIWGKGADKGPWVMGDLENGLWAGDSSPYDKNKTVPDTYTYVTAMVKGNKAGLNNWTIKVGNAQEGTLETPFDGSRPGGKGGPYEPMQKEGAIILGTGGDNSNSGQGNFFEGLMTTHYSSNEADNAVQANIVAAGYGK